MKPVCGKEETFQCSSEFDQNIAQDHLLVQVMGKNDRHFPLLMPSFVVKGMDMLGKPENRVNVPIGRLDLSLMYLIIILY